MTHEEEETYIGPILIFRHVCGTKHGETERRSSRKVQ